MSSLVTVGEPIRPSRNLVSKIALLDAVLLIPKNECFAYPASNNSFSYSFFKMSKASSLIASGDKDLPIGLFSFNFEYVPNNSFLIVLYLIVNGLEEI